MSRIDAIDIEKERSEALEVRLVSSGVEIVRGPAHTGICVVCGMTTDDIQNRRINTLFSDDESNWLESCKFLLRRHCRSLPRSVERVFQ